jgi:hypothetical protein
VRFDLRRFGLFFNDFARRAALARILADFRARLQAFALGSHAASF